MAKTLSIKDRTHVQISNSVYSDPPPKAAIIPQVERALKRYYTCKIFREALALWRQGTLTKEELAALARQNTPNALHEQAPGEYYRGGEPIHHELGTCYLSPGYYAIRALLKDVQSKVEAKADVHYNHSLLFYIIICVFLGGGQ